jgi:HEPN domain-containing protein
MKQPKAEARRWLTQAESDLAFAEVGLREGFFAQTCFVCQQTGEKALKALCYLRGDRVVLGHSLVELLATLAGADAVASEIREGAQQLDQYYVPTRYPNGLPGAVPAEVFTRRQAEEAVAIARRIVAFARGAIGQ